MHRTTVSLVHESVHPDIHHDAQGKEREQYRGAAIAHERQGYSGNRHKADYHADVDQDVKAAAYTMTAEDKSGTLHLTRILRNDLWMVSTENYPTLRSFFQLVRTGDEEQVVLQPGNGAAVN